VRNWLKHPGAYPLVIGLAAGILIAALVIPISQRDTTVTAAQRRAGVTTGDGAGDGSATGDDTTATSIAADGSVIRVGGAGTKTTTKGGTSGGGGGSGAASTKVPGVSATKIRIGVGIPDLGAVAALGPNYDDGDVQAQMNAVLKMWHEKHLVPINGRDIEFVYRSYDITQPDAQTAACVGWAQDDDVFAVITVNNFWSGAECLAGKYKVPLIVNDIYQDYAIKNSAPYLFSIPYSLDQLLRNWVHFAVSKGLLTKKTRIGLYYGNGTGGKPAVEGAFQQELAKLGFGNQVVARVTTDNYSTGGAEDPVAAQQFAAKQVDLALLLVSAINQTNFQNTATTLGYHPTYLGSDWLFTTNDTAAETFLPAQYDGTLALTSYRFGEESAGYPADPVAAACAANYTAHGGPQEDYKAKPAEWMSLQQGCDVARLILAALTAMGPNLTRLGVVAALENLPTQHMGIYSDLKWSPTDHTGTTAYRALTWKGSCTCWTASGAFAPYDVP
jgi:hypothetical protein